MNTVDAFDAVMVNFLTASSVLEATSTTSATQTAGTSSVTVASAAATAAVGGATDEGLLLLLRGDDGEGDLSGADGFFSDAALFLDAAEDRGCFAVTVSF